MLTCANVFAAAYTLMPLPNPPTLHDLMQSFCVDLDNDYHHDTPAMELEEIQKPAIESLEKPVLPGKGKPKPKTAGSGGALRTSAEPRRQLEATRVNGVLQIEDRLTKGFSTNLDILKRHIATIPHTHKSLGGTVSPLLRVSSFKMTIEEHVAIAREMFPNTKEEKTARKNFSKVLCAFAMNSDPTTSKKLGIYNVTFNEKQFEKTASYLMKGGNDKSGRADLRIKDEA